MDARKLNKIKRDIASARRKTCTHRDLEKIAKSLGRVRLKGEQARGNEPAYVSTIFPKANIITIPYHSGRDIAPGTKAKILDQIEQDIDRWEDKFERDTKIISRGNGHGKTNY